MKKLHKSQIISKLVAATPLTTISLLMRNFIANFVRILGICKDFAGNRVNEHGNVRRCGVVPQVFRPRSRGFGNNSRSIRV